MKKIINGKRYDTNTARLIDYTGNGLPDNDFNYWQEKLYLKKTGEFFIYGEGGARTQYAKFDTSGWSRGGSSIIPISTDHAKKWVEENSSVEIYETLFGPVDE